MLLEKGCDPNYFEKGKATVWVRLTDAVRNLKLRLMRRPPAGSEHLSVCLGTALHSAAYNGNLGAIDLLLKGGTDVASSKHLLKMTPMHAAAMLGHREVCARLLEAGAPTKTRDSRRLTPAAWAMRRGHPEIVDLIRTADLARRRPRGALLVPSTPSAAVQRETPGRTKV